MDRSNACPVDIRNRIITGHSVNPLGLSDAKWWHRSGSTLAQAMAWCLTAANHYLNQMATSHSSMQSCGIHLRAIWQRVSNLLFFTASLKTIFLTPLPHQPETNGLNAHQFWLFYFILFYFYNFRVLTDLNMFFRHLCSSSNETIILFTGCGYIIFVSKSKQHRAPKQCKVTGN